VKIDDAAKAAADAVREIKEDTVRRHKGRFDLETTIMCYRGNDPVGIVNLPPHRDEMLKMCYLAAHGFSADVLTVTHDSYLVYGTPEEVLNDPRTGKHWKAAGPDEPGSMQTYVDEFGFDGLVKESLVTHVVNRAGDSKSVVQPYEVVGRVVTWLEWPDREGMQTGGGVPEALKVCMDARTFEHLIPVEAYGLVGNDMERARFHMDVVTVQLIEEKAEVPVTVALFAKRGSKRDQMLRSRLSRSQVRDPSRWN
jgi:hypothetical protein